MFSLIGAPLKSTIHSENPSSTGKRHMFVGSKFLALGLLCLCTLPVFSQVSTRLLQEATFSTNAFTFTTSNYSPKAGTLALAVITNTSGSSSSPNSEAAPSSVSGNGLTWTLVKSLLYNSDNRRISVYRAVTGASPTTTSFTANFPGYQDDEMRRSCIIQIIEVQGTELTGSNGSDAISSVVEGTGNSKTATVSVNDITTSGASMLGLFGGDNHNENFTEETGWTMLSEKGVDNRNPIAAGIVNANNTYDKEAQITFGNKTKWGAIGIQLVPADYYFGFPCSSITTPTNSQTFNLWSAQTVCIQGNATGLTVNMTNNGASFAVKSGSPNFNAINFSNSPSFIVDQGANVTVSQILSLNSGSSLFIATGATLTINNDVNINGGNLRVYGNLVITGNLTINTGTLPGQLFAGSIGTITVNGTTTINNGQVLNNGGTIKTKTLVARGGASIEQAQGAIYEANIFNENNKTNLFTTGPGGGCLGMVGPNGAIATQNNGFSPITASSALKICLPSSGVTIGAYFNANKGNADVQLNCSGCATILGGNILPIQLLSFDGILSSTGTSQLSWKVANNDEVARFAVEYSTNGTTFEKVGSLKKGNSSTYRFEHSSTHKGLIYYRLLMYDKEGKATYSRIVTLLHGNESSTRILNVMPTATSSTTQVSLFSATQQQLTISIYDAAGRALKTEKKQVNKGLQNITLNLAGLPQGYLFINTLTQDGQYKTVKVMKM